LSWHFSLAGASFFTDNSTFIISSKCSNSK